MRVREAIQQSTYESDDKAQAEAQKSQIELTKSLDPKTVIEGQAEGMGFNRAKELSSAISDCRFDATEINRLIQLNSRRSRCIDNDINLDKLNKLKTLYSGLMFKEHVKAQVAPILRHMGVEDDRVQRIIDTSEDFAEFEGSFGIGRLSGILRPKSLEGIKYNVALALMLLYEDSLAQDRLRCDGQDDMLLYD